MSGRHERPPRFIVAYDSLGWHVRDDDDAIIARFNSTYHVEAFADLLNEGVTSSLYGALPAERSPGRHRAA